MVTNDWELVVNQSTPAHNANNGYKKNLVINGTSLRETNLKISGFKIETDNKKQEAEGLGRSTKTRFINI